MASSRHTRLRSDKYNANVTKRGAVAPTVDVSFIMFFFFKFHCLIISCNIFVESADHI